MDVRREGEKEEEGNGGGEGGPNFNTKCYSFPSFTLILVF